MGCKLLGELCSFYRGSSIPRARMYDSGDYLYIHYGDLYKGFDLRIDVESPQKPIPYIISNERIKDTQWLRDQDIVYVLTSETVDDLGNSFLFNNPQELPAVAGMETTIVRVDRRDLLVPAFLNYLMQTPRFKLLLRQYVKGMKVFRVHPSDLARIEIELPALSVQRKIVALCDAIIEKQLLNQRTNDYLAELRNALVKERISSALEHGIGDWRVAPLKDVAQIQSGYSYKSAELVAESSIGMLGIKNFNRNGSFRSDGFKPLKPEKAKSAQYVALGEIVVAHTDLTQNADIIGRAIQVIDSGGYDQVVASLDLVKVTSSGDSISNEFLAALLSTEDFHNHCLGYVNGTTVLHLGKKALPEYQLKIPEDMAIMSELDDAFKSIARQQAILIRESRHLERIRDALLPKLMSGEIDVSKIEVSTQLNNHLCVD